MANVQEFRRDGSKVELDEDGYILDPQVGDIDDDLTCMGCEDIGKVTLFDIVTWDAGRVEAWYCDSCLKEYERGA